MAIVKGQNLRLFLNNKVVAMATTCSMSVQAVVKEISHKDVEGGWAENRVVGLNWTLQSESVVCNDTAYGYTLEEGKLTLYLHSAVRGKKLDMIQANPKVFFAVDCDVLPFDGVRPCQYGMVYSSIMGRGEAHIVEDVEEKKQAMSILMKTQTGKDFTFEDRLVSIVAVIRIDVAEYTAKHRPLPEKMR